MTILFVYSRSRDEFVATCIINEVKGVNPAVYDITSKSLANIEARRAE